MTRQECRVAAWALCLVGACGLSSHAVAADSQNDRVTALEQKLDRSLKLIEQLAARVRELEAERAGTAIFIPVTNAIEALNAKLRRAVRARGHFPSDEAATKLLFLVLNRSEKEWIMPPREWAMAKSQFAVLFGERFTAAMN